MLERAQRAWTRSKLWWIVIVVIQVLSASLATWCAWVGPDHGAIAVALPALGALIPASTLFARARANAAYASGEAWRRALLLKDSLNHEPNTGEYAALLLDADASGPNLQRAPTGNYYGSKLKPGYPRLLENLAESAYYTTNLAAVMAKVCFAVVVIALAVLAVVIVAALASPVADAPMGDATQVPWLVRVGPQLASVISVMLAFFAAGQVVEIGLAYSGLASASRSVMHRALEKRVASPGAVLSVLGLYEGALAGAGLPVPDLLARMHGKALNDGWTAIRAQANAGKAAPIAKPHAPT